MLIQRRVLLPICVQGIPAEWVWEIAIEGQPNRLSGMIMNMVEIDRFMNEEKEKIGRATIASANDWLSSHRSAFETFLQDLRDVRRSPSLGENVSLYWSRLESPGAEFGRRFSSAKSVSNL